jgi:hypothetical protein
MFERYSKVRYRRSSVPAYRVFRFYYWASKGAKEDTWGWEYFGTTHTCVAASLSDSLSQQSKALLNNVPQKLPPRGSAGSHVISTTVACQIELEFDTQRYRPTQSRNKDSTVRHATVVLKVAFTGHKPNRNDRVDSEPSRLSRNWLVLNQTETTDSVPSCLLRIRLVQNQTEKRAYSTPSCLLRNWLVINQTETRVDSAPSCPLWNWLVLNKTETRAFSTPLRVGCRTGCQGLSFIYVLVTDVYTPASYSRASGFKYRPQSRLLRVIVFSSSSQIPE